MKRILIFILKLYHDPRTKYFFCRHNPTIAVFSGFNGLVNKGIATYQESDKTEIVCKCSKCGKIMASMTLPN